MFAENDADDLQRVPKEKIFPIVGHQELVSFARRTVGTNVAAVLEQNHERCQRYAERICEDSDQSKSHKGVVLCREAADLQINLEPLFIVGELVATEALEHLRDFAS